MNGQRPIRRRAWEAIGLVLAVLVLLPVILSMIRPVWVLISALLVIWYCRSRPY